ncbi:MAG: HDOD domain-containing protein [Labilithrix sp.]|nr:HDOD domain-containing protein [Labilithrix sp.]MCW5813039.1 HDOD domain-containing protein [Labilithrix sp.]
MNLEASSSPVVPGLPKQRALLVDDEARVVDAMQRALRPHRKTIEVHTATSGAAALALLEATHFDVLVTDMRMPGMDGAALLAQARVVRPQTMRIVLSGQTDMDAALRAVPYAHQFLTKPTEPSVLGELLARRASAQSAVGDAARAALGGIESLPSPPAFCRALARVLLHEEASVEEIARLVERDPAMAAKVLQIVSTSFFGVRKGICCVAEAVSYLGPELMERVCIYGGIMSPATSSSVGFDVERHHERAVEVATLARALAGPGAAGDGAFVAGVLHDVGRLATAIAMPAAYAAAPDACYVSNAVYLLNLWGLPAGVVTAIAEQATADGTGRGPLRPADAVYVARRLLDTEGAYGSAPEERAYLERLGILDRVVQRRAA